MQMAQSNYKPKPDPNTSDESVELENIYVQEKAGYDQANQAYQAKMQER